MSWQFGGWPPPPPSALGSVTFDAVRDALALATTSVSLGLGIYSLLDVAKFDGLALFASNDQQSIRLGDSLMPTDDGFNRIAIGTDAGNDLTTATDMVAIGNNSQRFVTTGGGNVSLGHDTLSSLVSGTGNTAIGDNAALGLTTGSSNVALGTLALENATTGARNVAIGHSAGHALTADNDNVFIGYQAGLLAASSNNVVVGKGAAPALTTGIATTAIGFGAAPDITTQNGSCMLGKGSGAGSVAAQHLCIGTDAVAPDLAVDSAMSIANRIYGGFNGTDYKVRLGGAGTIATQTEALQVTNTGADTVPGLAVNTTGTNGAKGSIYVGSRDPSGAVSALGGSLYLRVSGATSSLYINRTAGTGTSWSLVTAVP